MNMSRKMVLLAGPQRRSEGAIAGVKRDLNPRFNRNSYNITEQDKEIIEAAAVDLLFESNPQQKEIWRAYKQNTNDVAACFNGLDKVCVMCVVSILLKAAIMPIPIFKPIGIIGALKQHIRNCIPQSAKFTLMNAGRRPRNLSLHSVALHSKFLLIAIKSALYQYHFPH